MCREDSFFALTMGHQVGLAVLSLTLAIGLLWCCWQIGRRSRWLTRALISLGAFVVFSWVSPQVYYTYYLMIFDDLPVEWVITWPPDMAKTVAEFTFTGRSSLAAHGRGVLGWLCVLIPLAFGRFQPPVRHH